MLTQSLWAVTVLTQPLRRSAVSHTLMVPSLLLLNSQLEWASSDQMVPLCPLFARRERERERESVCVCVYCKCVSVTVLVCMVDPQDTNGKQSADIPLERFFVN